MEVSRRSSGPESRTPTISRPDVLLQAPSARVMLLPMRIRLLQIRGLLVSYEDHRHPLLVSLPYYFLIRRSFHTDLSKLTPVLV